MLIVVLEPLAPSGRRKAGKGGVALAPLNHELLKISGALLPHLSLGMRLDYSEQLCVAHPLSGRQLAGVCGREELEEYLL